VTDGLPVLPSTDYRGILDLEPREPIAAVLTMGRKAGDRGVTERDRYHLVDPHEGDDGARPYHPGFKSFNDAPPEKRRLIHGIIIHALEEECWWYQNAAHVLPAPWLKPPSRRNACVGGLKGGEMKARRYFGQRKERDASGAEVEVEDWREITCPNRLCEFQQGSPSPCSPAGRLYFQLRWPQTQAPLPCVETMYETHSAGTVAHVMGFFAQVHQQAAHLGVTRYSLYGLPFVLTMAQRRKKVGGQWRKWWESHMVADCVIQDFFLRQRREVAELGGELPERRLLTTVASRPPQPESGPVRKPAAGVEEILDGEVVAPEPPATAAPDSAALDATVDYVADQDAAVEAELQAAARKRGKRRDQTP
jgi:hypothetical protein